MATNFATVTVFTLLFTITTATISVNPQPSDLPHLPIAQTRCGSNYQLESVTDGSNLVVLPTETRSRSDGADQVKKSDTERLFKVDLTPRSDYARFHAINRRFYGQHRVPFHRRSQTPFVIPRSETSHRKEVILTGKSNIHRHGASASSRFMKFKHDYGHHHRNHNRHQHNRIHRNTNDDVSMAKRKFVREKTKSLVNEHKEKLETREHEAGFMKSIRKFLKHTFD